MDRIALLVQASPACRSATTRCSVPFSRSVP